MQKEEHINYWLKSAEHDLETAESLFKATRYDWCLFIGHLVLEKVLKALFVLKNENKVPPKTHNLLKLAELSVLDLSPDQKIFFAEVNDFNLEAGYPDYKLEFYRRCTKDFTENNFKKIKEYYQWLKSQIEC